MDRYDKPEGKPPLGHAVFLRTIVALNVGAIDDWGQTALTAKFNRTPCSAPKITISTTEDLRDRLVGWDLVIDSSP